MIEVTFEIEQTSDGSVELRLKSEHAIQMGTKAEVELAQLVLPLIQKVFENIGAETTQPVSSSIRAIGQG